jgi:hypothetical protein
VVADSVLAHIDDEDLVIHVVWTPVLENDDYESSVKAQFYIPDDRATHYWDGDVGLGNAYGRVVPLPNGRRLAWDIYFVYEKGVLWEEKPPEPDAWAHQLGLDDRHLSDGQRLLDDVREVLIAGRD